MEEATTEQHNEKGEEKWGGIGGDSGGGKWAVIEAAIAVVGGELWCCHGVGGQCGSGGSEREAEKTCVDT